MIFLCSLLTSSKIAFAILSTKLARLVSAIGGMGTGWTGVPFVAIRTHVHYLDGKLLNVAHMFRGSTST